MKSVPNPARQRALDRPRIRTRSLLQKRSRYLVDGVGISIDVPTETGMLAVIDLGHDESRDVYVLRIAGALFDQTPEGVTAAVQLAFLAIKEARS